MFDLYEEFVAVVKALENAAVEYAVCGGLAMAIWSIPRATVDIDLLIQPEHLEDALAAAKPLGYVIRAMPMSFANGAIEIRRVSKVDVGGDVMMLDFLLVTDAIAEVWSTRQGVEWEQGRMTVVSKEGLMRLKSLRGSGRDIDDIARLRGGQ